MSSFLALVRRELGVYFVSPLAYIILTSLLLLFGILFWTEIGKASDYSYPFYFREMLLMLAGILVFLTPLFTMRLLAEEKNRGTIETLLTAPVGETQVVTAKFVASLLFVLYILLPTAAHALLAAKYTTVDVAATATGYLGVVLLLSSTLALGLFLSAICQSQVTAGVVTFIATFLLLLTSILMERIPDSTWWGRAARTVVENINPMRYLEDFARGILDTRPVVYLASFTAFFLFLTVRVIETRRWR